jgi:hypothetical protein
MSRRAREEMPFGSDSFLDVLANIVGILIILIVAAAARMGRAPDLAILTQVAAPQTDASPAPAPREPEPPVSAAAEPVSDEPPAELTAEMQSISSRLSTLNDKSLAAEAKLKKYRIAQQAARDALSEEDRKAARQAEALREAQLRVARLEEALGDRRQALNGLLAEFEEAEKSKPPAIQVKHRLAPISQEIVGAELHFRVSGGRVTVVPLTALAERVKAQLERQKEWLASHGRHSAVVGPVDGYSMQYLVEKLPLSALDRHRLGYGAFRVGVKSADIIAEPDLVGETPEEALRRGSTFAMAVKMAPENAALTFWVYPDSFHAYRILQAACQAEGFVVAGRPLPQGHNIGVSSNGSRSAGQ